MALKKCKECEKELSTKADSCPYAQIIKWRILKCLELTQNIYKMMKG